MRLKNRVDALEQDTKSLLAIIVSERGETREQAIARCEAEHGPAVNWILIWTGVPRAVDGLCA